MYFIIVLYLPIRQNSSDMSMYVNNILYDVESKNAIFKFIIFSYHFNILYYYALFTSISRLNILSDSKFEYTPMSSTLSGE